MQEKVLLWFSLSALDAWWFIGQGQARAQSSERVPCEDETQEVCVGVEGQRSSLFFVSQALQKLANQYLKREWPDSLTEEQEDPR